MNRLLSIMLAVLMIVTSIPVDVHAAAPSLKVTNGQGEETTTFYVGEPIYVTAESDSADDWVAFYTDGQADGSAYWYWYYVNGTYDGGWSWEKGKTYNLYNETCPWKNGENGDFLPAGNYIVRLEKNPSVNGPTQLKRLLFKGQLCLKALHSLASVIQGI